jgi:hypothetical protein
MNTLETSISCEIDDLIKCVMADTGKSFQQVEKEIIHLPRKYQNFCNYKIR